MMGAPTDTFENLIRTVQPQGFDGDTGTFLRTLFGNFLVGIVLTAFDHIVAKHTKARWFALHAFGNLLVVMTSARCLFSCLTDPMNCADSRLYHDESLFGAASPWPVIITNTMHAYHLTYPLTADERFHHFLFIPTIGFMGQYFKWGGLQGSLAFFISGLPGGIDYAMLVLAKHGKVTGMFQKRLCAVLNVYLRGPGIVIVSFILWSAYLYNKTTVPSLVGFVIALMSIFNSLYYTKQSVANYSITHAVEHLHNVSNETSSNNSSVYKDKILKLPQSSMS